MTEKILKQIEDLQPQLRSEFWTTINEILREDCTQHCNNAKGTKIRMTRDSIIIEDSISPATITKLMKTKYLIGATDEGRIEIEMIVLGEDK